MKFEIKQITIRDITEGYIDNKEKGVKGYNRQLNIRPSYQREFIYKDKDRDEVVISILLGSSLGEFNWAKNENNTYEIIDGQQRTISLCKYVNGEFSIKHNGTIKYFFNLTNEEQEKFLDHKLNTQIMQGTLREKLEHFKRVNKQGQPLTNQELLNANYTGRWLSSAKYMFSKTMSKAYLLAGSYLKGSALRQDYLETAIKWISNKDIENYMANHTKDDDANELWIYFEKVIEWVKSLFTNFYQGMKGIEWGLLYNQYKDNEYVDLDKKLQILREDEDVTSKKGIFTYLITNETKHLNLRAFNKDMKIEKYQKQEGKCAKCNESKELKYMEGDHITPWVEGGKTSIDNLQMLCKTCNRTKSNK